MNTETFERLLAYIHTNHVVTRTLLSEAMNAEKNPETKKVLSQMLDRLEKDYRAITEARGLDETAGR